jgi:hypothetical protein
VESRHPQKLLRHLQNERGYTIAETAEGIYTVKGDILPMQIIDSRRLSADENLWLKSLRDDLDFLETTRIGEEITRQEKDAQIAAYLNVITNPRVVVLVRYLSQGTAYPSHTITEANSGSIQEAMEMGQRKQKLTIEQVIENTGLGAKWEARGKAEGGVEKAFAIAQNLVNLGVPFETVVSATQLEPEKVKVLYH